MDVTVKQVMSSVEALKSLSNERLPVAAAYSVMRAIRSLEVELVTAQEAADSLMRQYGTRTENGQYIIPSEKTEQFKTEYGELMAQELHIDINKIGMSSLSGITISPANLMRLEFLLDFDT